MKCQILFSRKNKKSIISLLSAELASSMVSVKVNQYASEKTTLSELFCLLYEKWSTWEQIFSFYSRSLFRRGLLCKIAKRKLSKLSPL